LEVAAIGDGWAAERVAEVLFIDAEIVREHRRLYQSAGVTGVERLNYEGSEPALTRSNSRRWELDWTPAFT